MNRKDFRPNSSSSTISDKDRATIRKEKAKKDFESGKRIPKAKEMYSKENREVNRDYSSEYDGKGQDKVLNKYSPRKSKDTKDAYLYDAFETRQDAINCIKDSGYKGYVRKGNYGDNGRLKYASFKSERNKQ